MIAELADDHLGDQPRPGDAAGNRPLRKRSRTDSLLAAAAGVFRADVDVGFQLRRLQLQFPRDVLADAVHLPATARADLLFFRQVVLMADLRQLVPVDLAFLAVAAMALHVDGVVGTRRVPQDRCWPASPSPNRTNGLALGLR